ncbi:MAG: GTPase/DUF3482 domain-containing protein [Idiomarina sp.]|nr:GTPase/DUF3482 domain-containing protein [Idiomarina sp.]
MESLNIAVVGHTNVGKTSLLRTLLRDSTFGEVSERPSTTQNVLAGHIRSPQCQIEFYDTPGLEDGIGLYEYLQRLAQHQQQRHDGPALLQAFLDSPEAQVSFAQEAKVIKQLLRSHAALYVIDARDPVLPKFQDELAILSKSARPVLPVLNFTASPNHFAEQWKQALAKVNLHASVDFDTVSPPRDGERRIYTTLATLLPEQQSTLHALTTQLDQHGLDREQTASHIIADMLVDCAALRLTVQESTTQSVQLKDAVTQLQNLVRQREQACVSSLLALYRFAADSISIDDLALSDGRWQDDLFHPQALRQFGISAGKSTAAGAAAGAGVDIFMLGTTLGAGTALGAAIGGIWQGWQSMGKKLRDQWRGYRELTVENKILQLLAARQQALAQHLSVRAHAQNKTQPLSYHANTQDAIIDYIESARVHPQWSKIGVSVGVKFRLRSSLPHADQQDRERLCDKISDELTKWRIRSK